MKSELFISRSCEYCPEMTAEAKKRGAKVTSVDFKPGFERAKELKINFVPTLVVYDGKGKVLSRCEGAPNDVKDTCKAFDRCIEIAKKKTSK